MPTYMNDPQANNKFQLLLKKYYLDDDSIMGSNNDL